MHLQWDSESDRASSRYLPIIMAQGSFPVCERLFFFTIIVGELFLSIMIVFGMVFSREIISIFRDDADVLAIATVALRAQLLTLFLLPMTSCTNMLFQSVGRNREATLLASLRNGLAFIPTLLILSMLMGLTGIEISQSIADIMTWLVTVPLAIGFIRKLPADMEDVV